MNHPTIGLIELLITLLCTYSLGVETMNFREGLADRSRVMRRKSDEISREIVNMDTRSNSVFVVFSVVLVVAAVRGLFQPEVGADLGRVVIYFLFGSGVAYKMWVSMRNREARWKILRPTAGEEAAAKLIVPGEDS